MMGYRTSIVGTDGSEKTVTLGRRDGAWVSV